LVITFYAVILFGWKFEEERGGGILWVRFKNFEIFAFLQFTEQNHKFTPCRILLEFCIMPVSPCL